MGQAGAAGDEQGEQQRGERSKAHDRGSRAGAPMDGVSSIWARPPASTHAVSARMTRAYPSAPRVGVLAVVRRGEKLLLVRRRNPPDAGKWGFPGGAQELGETVAEAAARELREETGVAARPRGVIDVIDAVTRDEAGEVQFHFTLLAVLMDWRDGEGVAADDAEALAWVTREEIDALRCSARVGAVAAKALADAAL
jgi:ADP-ribose pyrophosphatase YjhB (NUDIX family)